MTKRRAQKRAERRARETAVQVPSAGLAVAPVARPLGPPIPETKRTPKARADMLAELRLGSTKSAAAGAGRMSVRTMRSWEAEDEAFRQEVEDARAEGEAYLWREHRSVAIAEKDLRAMQWALARMRPEVYGQKAINVEAAVGIIAGDDGAKASLRLKLSAYLPDEEGTDDAGS